MTESAEKPSTDLRKYRMGPKVKRYADIPAENINAEVLRGIKDVQRELLNRQVRNAVGSIAFDPEHLGNVILSLRVVLGIERIELAEMMAARTGKSVTGYKNRLWTWETRQRTPEFGPYLLALNCLGFKINILAMTDEELEDFENSEIDNEVSRNDEEGSSVEQHKVGESDESQHVPE